VNRRKGKDLLPSIDFQRGYSKQVRVPDRVPVHVSLDPPIVTPTHTPSPYDWRMANGRPVRFNFYGCWVARLLCSYIMGELYFGQSWGTLIVTIVEVHLVA